MVLYKNILKKKDLKKSTHPAHLRSVEALRAPVRHFPRTCRMDGRRKDCLCTIQDKIQQIFCCKTVMILSQVILLNQHIV